MAKTIIVEVKTKGTKKAVKDIDNLNDSLGETNDELKEAEDNADALGDGIKKAGKDGQKGLGLLSKGFKGVGGAIKGMGLGILIGLFVILKETLERQQPVLDAIDTAITTIGLGVTAVSDALTSAFKSTSEATGGFDAMKKVVMGLLKLAITPLRLNFQLIKGAVLGAQLAWEQSFFGGKDEKKIAELKESLVGVKDELVQIGKDVIQNGKDIANNFGEAVTEAQAFGNAIIEETKKIDAQKILSDAQNTTRLKNNAILLKAQNELALITAARDAEIQREIRDDITRTFEERKLASDKLKVIIDEQEKLTMANAKLVVAAAEAELATNRSSIELQEKLIIAKKELIDAEETAIGFRTEQREQLRALNQEEIDSINNIIDRQTESSLKFEESELKKVQIVVDSNKKKVQSYIDAGDTESEMYRQAVQDLKASEDDKLVIITNAQKEAIKIVEELTQSKIDVEIEAIRKEGEEKIKTLKEVGLLTKELEEQITTDTNDSIANLNKEARAIERQKKIDAVADVANQANQVVDSLQGIMDGIDSLVDASIEKRNLKILEQNDANQARLDGIFAVDKKRIDAKAAHELQTTGKVSIATQNQIIDLNNKKLEDQFRLDKSLFRAQQRADKEANKQKRKTFKINKALALASAAINTALAVTSALSTMPYPLGVGLAIAAGIAGGIQIAAISSQKFSPSSTTGSAPKPPALASHVQPQDQSSLLGLSPSTTGDFSSDATFNRQELFGVGSESVGGSNQLKVTVLESDITDTQNSVSTIESASQFGG